MYPSTTIKVSVFLESFASNKPNNSFDLLNSLVSGELRYFGSPASMILPPKPINCPFILRMGKIILSLNRS